ncbi:Agrin [Hypsibius exemplaris]|uniref:Agrin n=1 Tax=Hypsibius exemplaris TaxID=2072580 RepID=A0A1W0WY86_HYPEX|nr:Agrin [Hypsibius exemplaris]
MFAIICEILLAFSCPVREESSCLFSYSPLFFHPLFTATPLQDPCRGRECLYGASCVGNYVTGKSECRCPATCDALPAAADAVDLRPSVFVCGSDNVTYDSSCQLRLKSCQDQRPIQVESVGVCGGCQRKQCDFYATCEVDSTGTPQCACPSKCPSERKPVCGVDGKTYDNECKLKQTACKEMRFIVVAAPYSCEATPSSSLPERLEDYEDADHDDSEDADSDYDLVIPSTGPSDVRPHHVRPSRKQCDPAFCKDLGGTCSSGQGSVQCLCKFNCSLSRGSVVCGKGSTDEDRKLFTNDCFLRLHACQQMKRLTAHPAAECKDVDVLPLHGAAEPLQHNTTHEELFCGEEEEAGAGSSSSADSAESKVINCPTGSFCHKSISTSFAKCCPQDSAVFAADDCATSEFGCCPDRITNAKDHHGSGCHTGRLPLPAAAGSHKEVCKCNKIGAVSTACDEETKQCRCKLGVGGARCDRCQPGFWGLQKTAAVAKGCIPCSCSNFGSVRPDCEQMTGRCVCKSGVLGLKCNTCPAGQVLQPSGCVSADLYPIVPSACGDLVCHLGAICVQKHGQATCQCNMTCKEHDAPQVVCGSDGMSYESVCQLRLHACRRQKDVTISAWGSCGEVARNYITIAPPVIVPHQSDMKRPYLDEDSATNDIVRDRESIPEPAKKSEGLLGSKCGTDSDCDVKNSSCVKERCVCRTGYESIPQKQHCSKITKKSKPCASRPCKNGASCTEPTPSTFTCRCLPGFQGKHCEEDSLTVVPSFGGKSYFELRPISGYTQMTIELEFKSHVLDGILLYNGQKPDGSGDFVSLSLNNGFVEFRFDLGDGPAVIRSATPITLEKRHRIIAKRFNQDGMLRLDGHPEVLGRCSGVRQFLDLEDSLFIGYVPTSNPSVFDRIGTKMGLVGCIYSMKLGKQFIGLTDPDFRDTIAAFEIGECGKSVCASSPCQNGGTCESTSKGLQYACKCSDGYSGHQCEVSSTCKNCQTSTRSVDGPENQMFLCADGSHKAVCDSGPPRPPAIPDFSGHSFLTLPRISDANPQLNLEIWFLSRSPSGLLLYASQKHAGDGGDFISLNLRFRRVEFVFDLGDGPVNITYPDQVSLFTWHSVKVFRHGKRASLQLDSAAVVSSESQGVLAELNLDTVTHVGGAKNHTHLSRAAKIGAFFDGAIQLLSINHKLWNDFSKDALEMHAIGPFEGAPCHQEQEQCLNGGMCIPRLSKYRCKCPPGFGGEKCEKEIGSVGNLPLSDQAVHFDGHTVMEYPNLVSQSQDSQDKNSYTFRLRTTARNGLIIWQSKGKSIRGDFLSLAVIDGSVEFAFDLGKEKEIFILRSDVVVSDGKWHTVNAERKKRSGILQVDDEKPQSGTSTPGTTVLNTNGKMLIGGSMEMPPGFSSGYYQGFNGCLTALSVDGKALAFLANGTTGLQLCAEEH